VRKGTGFVSAADLPSDEEEEPDSQRRVAFDPSSQAGSDAGPAVRRGTGFVGMAELPSDDEEDDEPAAHRVAFDPGTQEGSGGLVARVKTGAVTTRMEGPDSPQGHGRLQVRQKTSRLASGDLAQLCSSDEEVDAAGEPSPASGSREAPQVAESQLAKVSFDPAEDEKPEIPKTGTKVTSRKGTGFLRKEDLQDLPSDEEEEADEAQQMAHGDKAVSFEAGSQIQESEDQPRRVVARKGTGFLHAGDVENLVDEEEEEEEEEEDGRRKVGFEKPAEQAQREREGKPVARKGTGFVNVGDLPSDDE
ncbi:AMT1-1, partial [Symbiodinium sp. CCMP2456]